MGGVVLIGTHMCLQLLSDGCEVFCVDTRNATLSPLLRDARDKANFRYVHHNVTTGFGIRCDEIYNLASPTALRYDRMQPVETLRVNILGSLNALVAARAEYARILFTSSDDVYASSRTDSCTEGSVGSVCTQSLIDGKRAAEAMYRAYAQEYGIDARIARLFSTYGSGADINDNRVVMRMIVEALQNRDITIFGSGEQIRTFCWVGDIVNGLIKLMATPPSATVRTMNFGSTHEITIRALAEKIIDLTGSSSRLNHLPARPDEVHSKMPDISLARRELDWTPQIPLIEGLKRTISYVEKELATATLASKSWIEIHG